MIKITDLRLTFEGRKSKSEALKGIDLEIPEGTIFGFIGSNGAGKSTLMRTVCGIYRPDSGSVTIDGREVYDDPKAKEQIFFVSDDTAQFAGFTLKEIERFYKSCYKNFSEETFESLTKRLELPEDQRLAQFSKGMKRQAIACAALACNTKYVLLDEAFDGLDPAMRKLIRQMVVDNIFDRGATIIVSSQNITEIGEICDRAMLLHKGEVVFSSDVDDVREHFEKVQIAPATGEYSRSQLEQTGVDVRNFKTVGKVATAIVKGEKEDITSKLSTLSPVLLELVPMTLEEIFIYEMEVRGYAVGDNE